MKRFGSATWNGDLREGKGSVSTESRALEKRFALDKLKVRDIPTAKMQEIESVIDEAHAASAVGRCLRLGEARQTGLVDAAEFAVDIGGFHPDIG
jgi:hypothetical protein